MTPTTTNLSVLALCAATLIACATELDDRELGPIDDDVRQLAEDAHASALPLRDGPSVAPRLTASISLSGASCDDLVNRWVDSSPEPGVQLAATVVAPAADDIWVVRFDEAATQTWFLPTPNGTVDITLADGLNELMAVARAGDELVASRPCIVDYTPPEVWVDLELDDVACGSQLGDDDDASPEPGIQIAVRPIVGEPADDVWVRVAGSGGEHWLDAKNGDRLLVTLAPGTHTIGAIAMADTRVGGSRFCELTVGDR